MMKENAYKSDMEPFVRGEMLFIRDSLCNRYNAVSYTHLRAHET